ncbi:Multiubiquitin [Desulfomicrobium norvegicum]|uniref:Multiubiquitin n=1 Tax=Desulfomicrobium norvegicum (strain DSM 1741 / NCIMB 8310) TaxID=52561 RepID=A0A8G2FE66_DESNO|nr:multiubiquitin domain-containing protein [Desulfomicrobium norvegicum]SFL69427.1 Multiubiquitin [Desulfomicrobium norvegicum]
MNPHELPDYDDLGEALREDRPLRRAHWYRFLLAQGDLNFLTQQVSDPVPLGRQLLEAAGLNPQDGYSLFGILPSGDFEDVRLNEPFDLREHGTERFVAFLTDRDFKLTLNGNDLRWGKPAISGNILYSLAKADGELGIFLEVPDGEQRPIEPHELVDLTGLGIERFVTAPKLPLKFEIIVNARPRTIEKSTVTFEQIVQFAFPGQHDSKVVFSMTYRHAASSPHVGELGPEGIVEVKKKGTVFNVTRTVQS